MQHFADIFRFRTSGGRSVTVLVAAVLSVILTACSVQEDAPSVNTGSVPSGTLSAGFTVTLSSNIDAGKGSQGYLGEGYDKGEGFENYIDMDGGDYRVFVYTDDNDGAASMCIGELAGIQITARETVESSKTYTIRGILDAEISRRVRAGEKIKFVFLANWHGSYENAGYGKTLDELARTKFDFTPDMTELSAEKNIPMFGITNPLQLTFDSDNYADIGVIHLLRAYAKVEVANADEGGIIDDVRLVYHFDSTAPAPDNVTRQDDYVHGNWNDDYTEAPTVPQGAGVNETALQFVQVADNRWIIYIPEFDISREATRKPEIKVHFSGYPDYDTLYFRYYGYNGNSYFNIMRNNWYRFTVKKSLYFYVMVNVMPYISVDLNPGFGYDDLLSRIPVAGAQPSWVIVPDREK